MFFLFFSCCLIPKLVLFVILDIFLFFLFFSTNTKREALDSFDPGDACTVFTPDDTHFDIAMEAVKRGMHAIVTKPVVKTLKEHRLLHEAARDAGVLVMVEVHKRFDPIYVDARDRIRDLGGMSYMYSYMSQPKVR